MMLVWLLSVLRHFIHVAGQQAPQVYPLQPPETGLNFHAIGEGIIVAGVIALVTVAFSIRDDVRSLTQTVKDLSDDRTDHEKRIRRLERPMLRHSDETNS